MSELELSKVLPGWTQEGILGSGSFGTVYLVRNTETGSFSAVKVIKMPPTQEAIDNAVKLGIGRDLLSTYFGKFKNDLSWELTMYKTVKSAHLADLEDIVTADAQGPGWTGFIRTGIYTPMATYFEKSTPTQEDAARMGAELASALDALTQYGMVHGEIKPENVFVNDMGAYILGDFAVRRCLEKAGSGIFGAGEDEFEAPEIGEERKYTAQSDIYSLGSLMCYTANGCQMPTNRDPNNIRGIDPAFAAIIKKATSADPGERYQTAMQLKIDLERLPLGKKPARRAMAAAAAFDAVKKNGGAAITSGAVITGKGVTKQKPGTGTAAKAEPTDSAAKTARAGEENRSAEKKKNNKAGLIIALIAGLLILAVILWLWVPWDKLKKNDPTDPSDTQGVTLFPSDSIGPEDTAGPEDSTAPDDTSTGPEDTTGPDDTTGPEGTTGPASDPTEPSAEPPVTEPPVTEPPVTQPPATQPTQPTQPTAPNNDILFPSDTQLITKEYLATKSREEVNLILNEMYARHGYIFASGGEMQKYFESQQWYTPVTTSASRIVSQFNKTEQANLTTITDYQKEMGWRGGTASTQPTQPTEPATEPTEPAAEPTEPTEPTEPPEDPTQPPVTEDGYLYPTDKQVITHAELEGMTRSEINYVVNEMYARHGYIFTNAELKAYFESQSWYIPVTTDAVLAYSAFNENELKNMEVITAYRKEMGWA